SWRRVEQALRGRVRRHPNSSIQAPRGLCASRRVLKVLLLRNGGASTTPATRQALALGPAARREQWRPLGNLESARECASRILIARVRRPGSVAARAQKMITDRAISPDPIAAKASLTSSSLISREISSSSFSSPRLYRSRSFGTSRSTFDDPYQQPRSALL